ncbi:dihydrofolate reductase [Coxiella endosymbiont of Amblyomma sculptum]|uniref:dihydrofolate reductase n=1 Tax=Coxiella endosymbiont of Amblyomma sculptum TaxID=2487929 RepID=UPI00132EBD59|nr:dihydrofolate reductase [Coxiella endosymbiont of Amblyomma sculptum]QHG92390.1 dihydrofolate reductase [Coxiella endosymbiont of Amblyomma sculptum]
MNTCKTIVTLVAAMDRNRAIGYRNRLPWHLPADLNHFKSVTLRHSIVMGRKTFESIGKPMPFRNNVVITRKESTLIRGCVVFHSFDEALDALSGKSEIMVIGGGELFKEALPKARRMVLTIIEYDFEGDTYFPIWNDKEWFVSSREDHMSNKDNNFRFSFLELKRK